MLPAGSERPGLPTAVPPMLQLMHGDASEEHWQACDECVTEKDAELPSIVPRRFMVVPVTRYGHELSAGVTSTAAEILDGLQNLCLNEHLSVRIAYMSKGRKQNFVPSNTHQVM